VGNELRDLRNQRVEALPSGYRCRIQGKLTPASGTITRRALLQKAQSLRRCLDCGESMLQPQRPQAPELLRRLHDRATAP
jgi:hypothetical protein